MLTLAFTFPSGRYYATPWDRHVNEGAVVWPPEPWRVLRALIATWHHKLKHTGKHDEATLGALIEALSQDLPEYALPAASHSHTRHYMPQWKPGDTSLVFDAFAVVDRTEVLLMGWKDTELPPPQLALLDDLLEVMGYLGRAESWVEARRFSGDFNPNCRPSSTAIDPQSGQVREVVTLLAPLPASEYATLRERFLPDKKAEKKLGAALPPDLLDALSVETSALRKQGWSQPPAARKVNYLRPVEALRPKRSIHAEPLCDVTTICYLLIGKPLPRVEDSVRIGELLRKAVMKQFGEHAIPPKFSGHDLAPGNRHRHAFYLPWDANGDGRIDRIVLHIPEGMQPHERRIAEKLHRLWSRDGSKWRLVVENVGGPAAGGSLLASVATWESVTPYLHPWHTKKNFDTQAQIRRECRERGLPEPERIEAIPVVQVGPQTRTPIHFHRFRAKRGLHQPDRHGSLWRLTFPEPIDGPLALGFGCHFGLGLFRPLI